MSIVFSSSNDKAMDEIMRILGMVLFNLKNWIAQSPRHAPGKSRQ